MSATASHFLGWWPMLIAAFGGLFATVIAIRYKLPELTKRVDAVEKGTAKNPSKKDLETSMESFHAICRFNRVSCQKALDAQVFQVKQDLESKLAELYELMNQQAILMARVDERVAYMHNNGGKRADDCNGGQHCLFIPPKPMVQHDVK